MNILLAKRGTPDLLSSVITMGRGIATILIAIIAGSCGRYSGLPKVAPREYRHLVSAFYVGLAGLQTGEDVRAKTKLTLATQIAPGEPASWANLGLLAVRQQEFESAYADVEKARAGAPGNTPPQARPCPVRGERGPAA